MWKYLLSNQNDYRLTDHKHSPHYSISSLQRDHLHSTLRLEKKCIWVVRIQVGHLSPHPVHTAHYLSVSTNNQEQRQTESVDRMKAATILTINERRENHADWRKLLADGLGRHVFTLSLSYRVQLHIFFVGKCLNPANMPYL